MAVVKQYKVKSPVKNFCGIGAAGVQFAYGEAIVNEGWVLEWYREHGFEIEEIKAESEAEAETESEAKAEAKAKAKAKAKAE